MLSKTASALCEHLRENYKEAEPIFFSDIEMEDVSRSAVNQQLKLLCEENKLIKYDTGIYYLPKKTRLCAQAGINAGMVAQYKYISRRGEVFGYYSGHTFANRLGISLQVPNKVEIVSNHTAAKVKEVRIGNRDFIVKKPYVPVNEENVYTLQLLDLLKNPVPYMDGDFRQMKGICKEFALRHRITGEEIDRYIRAFPSGVFRYYYELGLYDVLA